MNDSLHPPLEYWVKHLNLEPHPEGGYYRGVGRGNYTIPNQNGLPRFVYSSIYFLLTPESPSHLHRLCSDETWLYHAGDPLQVHVLLEHPNDELLTLRPGLKPSIVQDDGPSSESPDDWPITSNTDNNNNNTDSHTLSPEHPEDYPLHTPFLPTHLAASVAENVPGTEDVAAQLTYQRYRRVPVGPRVHKGECLQYTVPAKAIFGSSVAPGGTAGYSLVSCVVSPGFDFRDFELFTQAELMQLCPQHEAVIRDMAYETIPDGA